MKIGLLLPSILLSSRFKELIYAPKPLFLDLADGLVKKGHEVYVYGAPGTQTTATLVAGDQLLSQKNYPSIRYRKKKNEFVEMSLMKLEYESDLTARAYIHAKENNLDIMHSYSEPMAHYFSKLSSIPTVYTLHDPAFLPDTIEGWRFDHFSSDNYVAISQSQRSIFEKRVTVLDTVYHGIHADANVHSYESGEYLAFAGRIIPEKGVLDAMEVSVQTNEPLHLATSSNYFETPYYKDLVEPKLKNNLFTMTGYLDTDALQAWLKRAKAFLFPIKWEEPFGMVMIEAMACGTPVVAYNRGSVPEVVKDGVTGFIVQQDDKTNSKQNKNSNFKISKTGIEGLVEAVNRIDEIDRRACRKHVEENFTVAKMVEGYERVYEKVVASS